MIVKDAMNTRQARAKRMKELEELVIRKAVEFGVGRDDRYRHLGADYRYVLS